MVWGCGRSDGGLILVLGLGLGGGFGCASGGEGIGVSGLVGRWGVSSMGLAG